MIKTTRTVEYKYTFNGTDLAMSRESLGLSQARLADITGIDRTHISRYERPGPVTVRESTKILFESAGIVFGD